MKGKTTINLPPLGFLLSPLFGSGVWNIVIGYSVFLRFPQGAEQVPRFLWTIRVKYFVRINQSHHVYWDLLALMKLLIKCRTSVWNDKSARSVSDGIIILSLLTFIRGVFFVMVDTMKNRSSRSYLYYLNREWVLAYCKESVCCFCWSSIISANFCLMRFDVAAVSSSVLQRIGELFSSSTFVASLTIKFSILRR